MKAKSDWTNKFRRSNPKRKKSIAAYSLIDLLGGIACLVIFATIFLPRFPVAKTRATGINCINNLKQISIGFHQWDGVSDRWPMKLSVTNGGTMELVDSGRVWVHFNAMSNELGTPKVLICPGDKRTNLVQATTFGTTNGSSAIGIPFNSDRSVSYFLGVDAMETSPQGWLMGDSELAVSNKLISPGLVTVSTNDAISWPVPRHGKQWGNIGLADGSVVRLGNRDIGRSLKDTQAATTRLAMP